jgi:hypothetical protein
LVQYKNNHLVALTIILGIVISIILSPFDKYFIGNFAFYWVPQAIVLVVLFLTKVKTEFIAGTSLVMLTFLCAFYFWAKESEPMVWLLYVFSYPGILVGTFAVGYIAKYEVTFSSFRFFSYGFISSLIGLLINIAAIFLVL